MGFRPCPHCGKTISSKSRQCSGCGTRRPFKSSVAIAAPASPAGGSANAAGDPINAAVEPIGTERVPDQPSARRPGTPQCTLCHGDMAKKTQSSGSVPGIIGGILLLIVGLLITVLLPVVGWVIGPLIMLYALFMGGKRRRVWRCVDCGHIAERSDSGSGSWVGRAIAGLFLLGVLIAIATPDPPSSHSEPDSAGSGQSDTQDKPAGPDKAERQHVASKTLNEGDSTQTKIDNIAQNLGAPNGLSRQQICARIEGIAATVMRKRQDGKRMSEAMADAGSSTVRVAIVEDAYSKPRFQTDKVQQQTIDDFASDLYRACWDNFE